MKRILQISNYYYPHIGGIEQVAHDISDSLFDLDDIEQKLICFNEDANDGKLICKRRETVLEVIDGVDVVRCGCFAKVASQSLSLTYLQELKKTINSFKPDTIIFHFPNPFVASLLLPIIPKNTKLYIWWHLDIVKQKLLGKLFTRQTESLCRRADKIIATSPNYIEGSFFLTKYKYKCQVIPNCIRPDRFIESEKTKQKTIEIKSQYSNKTICFAIGRHVPYKGMGSLIEASQYLDDSVVILIGGNGELTKTLKEKAKDNKNVVFVGRPSDEDLIAYYKACDIFCFPSITKNEAFGIALAEGMFFGKPAITYTINGSGVNYVSLDGVTGIECPNQDSYSFANAIKKLSTDSALREEYGKAGKERVEEYFLFDQFKKTVNEICEEKN